VVVVMLLAPARRVGELAVAVGTSGPAMSKHLRVLRAHGLVEERPDARDARVRVYRLRPEPFLALRAWLDQVETYWGDQLGAFKAHAERPPEDRAEGGQP
jgi:DNA-binding transcriptional ArsR family regulator